MDIMFNDEKFISQRDYWNLVHAALGPVVYASLGSVVLPLFNSEPSEVRDSALIGLVSSVPSLMIALALRWVPPCQPTIGRCLSSLGKAQHVLNAIVYGASTGVGQFFGVAPSMSASHVMLASELGVTASVLGLGLGVLLKNAPRQCRILKATYWPNEDDMVRMPRDDASFWSPEPDARSISNNSHLSENMLTQESSDAHSEPDLQVLSAF